MEISICWLRRDLRLTDQAALYHALKGDYPVLVLFIFDKTILDQLDNKYDPRVQFIYEQLLQINKTLQLSQSSLLVKYGSPYEIWENLTRTYKIKAVYYNHDYEPYATRRDQQINSLLTAKQIAVHSYKDQVIFEKNEVCKQDGLPYTVFTPYFKVWQQKLNDFYLTSYPSENYFDNFYKISISLAISLQEIGFNASSTSFPELNFEKKLANYENNRDLPAKDATTYIGIHLRFGTISIRKAAQSAIAFHAHKWLSELAWRDFYAQILWHFPHSAQSAFKPPYDLIKWINNEEEFKAWCDGKTGYPLVDAGMRQLNQTGFMHNRVRMVVASFLCKHLLIDWRWGESYFAAKLLDYDQASNVGGWQWASGSGNDAAPYFRVFNPVLQQQKFDPKMEYIFKWAPEYQQALIPILPIVEHSFAKERAIKTYQNALK